ncbi:hypothetical protein EDB81DRAFT_930051 [Dactylonectria macrodidyma]|uniref:Uncharacterized protein n=1 Tax=Dactylonectria macrodidyma TaxID=307937 RepID=A0A9P9I6W3_9HYPO|nr:hypothetical protein EDB81DRAFT_930051 [Dactylonectria macrodidyma]
MAFECRQVAILEDENRPHIETGRDLGVPETELVEFFMTDSATADRPVPSIECVTAFCPGDALQELQHGNPSVTSESVALLDEWTHDGTESAVTCRYLRPLSARRLYLSLLEKSSIFPEGRTAGGSNGTASQQDDQSRSRKSNRRVIFITDLNRYSTAALISTATINQARGLRESLYRHLAFRSFIGEIPPPTKFQLFQLVFDLPCYVLRTAPRHRQPTDPRENGKGGPLREVIDLSFLQRSPLSPPPTEMDYLCQAQISLLITGTHDSQWVAYFFVDTYFEDQDASESVEKYQELRGNDQNERHVDPLTGGQSDAPIPDLTPQEYFLIVIEPRLRQCKDEWHNTVTNMRHKIESYVNLCPLTSPGLSHSPTSQDPSTVTESRNAIIRTKRLLDQLAHVLKTTLNQWKSCNTDKMFATVPERSPRYLPELEYHFKQLEQDLGELEFLREMCEEYKSDLSFHLKHEGRLDVKDQNRKAGFTQVMSLVMLGLVTPIALAAAVLSMQPNAIPRPLAVNSTSFISLAAILMLLIWASVGATMNWEHIRGWLMVRFKEAPDDEDLENQRG